MFFTGESEDPGIAQLDEERAAGLGKVDAVAAEVVIRVAQEENRTRIELVGEQYLGE